MAAKDNSVSLPDLYTTTQRFFGPRSLSVLLQPLCTLRECLRTLKTVQKALRRSSLNVPENLPGVHGVFRRVWFVLFDK